MNLFCFATQPILPNLMELEPMHETPAIESFPHVSSSFVSVARKLMKVIIVICYVKYCEYIAVAGLLYCINFTRLLPVFRQKTHKFMYFYESTMNLFAYSSQRSRFCFLCCVCVA